MSITRETAKLSDLHEYPGNPRQINKKDFEKLKRSLKEFPEMLEARELVVDENGTILGGNQRYKALLAIGETTAPVKRVTGWSDEQKRQFVIKDNVANGDWDFDILANEWDADQLEDWGVDIPKDETESYQDMIDFEIPTYEPADQQPALSECYDDSQTSELLAKIDELDASDELKRMLRARAGFFTDFNFQKIADYYAHSDEPIKSIMKDLGLVIVQPREAFERGILQFRKDLEVAIGDDD